MVRGERMSGEQRRAAILQAAIPLFAKQGFKGTTTKDIAAAAEVSEALLYRHFPSKDAMYEAIKSECCTANAEIEHLLPKLKPSTSTLVHLIAYLVTHIAEDPKSNQGGLSNQNVHRLMAKSYLEDGAFARTFIREKLHQWEQLLTECMEAASQSGDRIPGAVDDRCGAWFTHHLAVALGMFSLPSEPVIDYGVDRPTLIREAIRFSLRGMGLTELAIHTHYNPDAMAMMHGNLF